MMSAPDAYRRHANGDSHSLINRVGRRLDFCWLLESAHRTAAGTERSIHVNRTGFDFETDTRHAVGHRDDAGIRSRRWPLRLHMGLAIGEQSESRARRERTL